MAVGAAPPYNDPIAVPADPKHPLAAKLPKLKAGGKWARWWTDRQIEIDERVRTWPAVNLTNQSAAIAVTAIPIGSVSPGVWRINATLRVTTPGTISSAVQLTLTWVEGGVTQTESGSLLNGNLTTTREGKPFVIRVDDATPISYSTTYASAGATAMQYSLDLVPEELALDS